MNLIYKILPILAIVIILFLGFNWRNFTITNKTPEKNVEVKAPIAYASKTILSSTSTPKIIPTKMVDLSIEPERADGGVCYKLSDNDGEGFTYLIANNGKIIGSLTCD